MFIRSQTHTHKHTHQYRLANIGCSNTGITVREILGQVGEGESGEKGL